MKPSKYFQLRMVLQCPHVLRVAIRRWWQLFGRDREVVLLREPEASQASSGRVRPVWTDAGAEVWWWSPYPWVLLEPIKQDF